MAFSPDETPMTTRDDSDPLAPHREAAFFYGLFLRGHSLNALREDIDVPRPVVDKWLKAKDFEAALSPIWIAFISTANGFWRFSKGLVSTEHARVPVQ